MSEKNKVLNRLVLNIPLLSSGQRFPIKKKVLSLKVIGYEYVQAYIHENFAVFINSENECYFVGKNIPLFLNKYVEDIRVDILNTGGSLYLTPSTIEIVCE